MNDVLLVVLASLLVNTMHKEPYMDEVFHIGQLETYLEGRLLEWDPKITTLPGLYIMSYFPVKILSMPNWVSVLSLARGVNVVIWVICLYLVREMRGERKASLILWYPPVFLTATLYYTDSFALLMCLLYYKNINYR